MPSVEILTYTSVLKVFCVKQSKNVANRFDMFYFEILNWKSSFHYGCLIVGAEFFRVLQLESPLPVSQFTLTEGVCSHFKLFHLRNDKVDVNSCDKHHHRHF